MTRARKQGKGLTDAGRLALARTWPHLARVDAEAVRGWLADMSQHMGTHRVTTTEVHIINTLLAAQRPLLKWKRKRHWHYLMLGRLRVGNVFHHKGDCLWGLPGEGMLPAGTLEEAKGHLKKAVEEALGWAS